ncbi:MAG: carboxypeptidase regulatory-like domain-containing protein, partial [Actinomycetales bacterium]|nr:carboxypeptidase regulatory-like domain-containing protein [Actinomycetales bacterium]
MPGATEQPSGSMILVGQVVGQDGEAIGGASVWIESASDRATETDTDGRFAFDGLSPGGYVLMARKGELTGGPHPVRVAGSSAPVVIRLEPGVAARVTVLDDASQPIEGAVVWVLGDPMTAQTDAQGTARLAGLSPGWLELEAQAHGFAPGRMSTILDAAGAEGRVTITLAKGVPVAGRVRDVRGVGIPGVQVFAVPAGHLLERQARASAVTGADGTFSIAAIAPGAYWFAFVRDGRRETRTSGRLVERAVDDLEIVMDDGALVAGAVVDPDGRPASHATVHLEPLDDHLGLLRPRKTSSGADGAFELRGLSEARYALHAESEAGVSQVYVIDLDAREPAPRHLGLVIESAVEIAGVVVDDTGAPVPGIIVQARSQERASTFASSATTGAGGEFLIEHLPTGRFTVWAGREERPADQGIEVMAGDHDVRLEVSRAGAIRGEVVLDATGAAPGRFRIRLEAPDQRPLRTSGGEDGKFEVRGLWPGEYTLVFYGPELVETRTAPVALSPGETLDLGRVRVQRGRTISGQVVDGAGRPVAGAKVRMGRGPFAWPTFDDSLSEVRSTVSDTRGAFSIVGLQPATSHISIEAEHPRHGRSLTVDVPGGVADPPPVTLVLRGVGSVVGMVVQAGQPLAHALIGAGDPELAGSTTDERGQFLLPAVPEGALVLRVLSPPDYRAHTHTVQVVAGAQSRVTIDVPAGNVSLAAMVRPDASASFAFAEVMLFQGDRAFSNRRELIARYISGGQGAGIWSGPSTPPLRFERLAPGDYTLCAVPLTQDPFA